MKLDLTLDLPKDVAKGFLSGKLDVSNVVVRSKETGKIIQYIKGKAVNKIDNMKGIAENITGKNLLIGIGITAAVVTVGGIINLVVNKSSDKESVKVPKCINDFQKKFHKYLKEAQKGVLNVKTIDDLLNTLNEVEQLKNKEIKIDFSAKELKYILNKIYDFTNNINQENKDLKLKIKSPSNNSKKNIVYLKDYLEYQKQVVENVS